jgi:hypothetical protein
MPTHGYFDTLGSSGPSSRLTKDGDNAEVVGLTRREGRGGMSPHLESHGVRVYACVIQYHMSKNIYTIWTSNKIFIKYLHTRVLYQKM